MLQQNLEFSVTVLVHNNKYFVRGEEMQIFIVKHLLWWPVTSRQDDLKSYDHYFYIGSSILQLDEVHSN